MDRRAFIKYSACTVALLQYNKSAYSVPNAVPQEYSIPSLVSGNNWTLKLTGNQVTWDSLFKRWYKEKILSGWRAVSTSYVGTFFTFDVNDSGILRISFSQPTSPWSFAGKDEFAPKNVEKDEDDEDDKNVWYAGGNPKNKTLPRVGVFADSDKKLWLQLVLNGSNLKLNQPYPIMPPFGLRGAFIKSPEKKEKNSPVDSGATWSAESVAFFHQLDNPHESAWHVLMQTATKQFYESTERFNATPFLLILNHAMRQARGSQFGGQPFSGLTPFFEQVKEHLFNPIALARLIETANKKQLIDAANKKDKDEHKVWSASVLKLLLGKDAFQKDLEVCLDWSSFLWDKNSQSNYGTGFSFRGSFNSNKSGQFPEQYEKTIRWSKDGKELINTFKRLKQISDDASKPLVEFSLENCRLIVTNVQQFEALEKNDTFDARNPSSGNEAAKKPVVHEVPWIRMGSIEIKPTGFKKDSEFIAKFSGNWSSEAIDLFPDTELTGLECQVRYAAGTDPVPEFVRNDRIGGKSDLVKFETSPIVALLQTGTPKIRTGTLAITSKFQQGMQALTEMDIVLDADFAEDKEFSSAIWLNLRPFLIAQISLPKSKNASATLRWRSDDKKGAQWLVEHTKVEVILPPQAVGEEMERGSRFWPNDNSYINKGEPLKYRFSRPTYLSLRPSPKEQNRRFDRSPLNLRELIRGAEVDRMITEMVYPIEIKYERTSKSNRQFRLTEVGEFFGSPTENLDREKRKIKGGADLPFGLAQYVKSLKDESKESKDFLNDVSSIIAMQDAVQTNFVSRLAELYIHDPARPRSDVQMAEDVEFTIRRHKKDGKIKEDAPYDPLGAAPLFNPLPNSAGGEIESEIPFGFLKTEIKDGKEKEIWGTPKTGSIRAGVIHSFEMGSELIEVLKTPKTVNGVIESLALSALGSTGKMQAAFADGKTTFAVEVAHGQLSRLVKTRIGRIGALWNHAKHVIVYERTAAPSAQFKREQCQKTHNGEDPSCVGEPFNQWPILRKIEEYVELIQPERVFAEEQDAKKNSAHFVDASVFASTRIYVNSAWARNMKDGYELPLWNPVAALLEPAFYPRPQAFIRCFGEEGKKSKLWICEPQRLYFYTSTISGESADTDGWKSLAGVDFDNSPRLPILDISAKEVKGRMASGSADSIDICTSLRFDLKVDSDGPVNMHHGTGQTPMLVRLDRICISRSSQASAKQIEDIKAKPTFKTALDVTIEAGELAHKAKNIAPALERLKKSLLADIQKQLVSKAECEDFVASLKKKIKYEQGELIKQLTSLPEELKKPRDESSWIKALEDLVDRLYESALIHGTLPSKLLEKAPPVLDERVKALKGVFEDVERKLKGLDGEPNEEIKKILGAVRSDVEAFRLDIKNRLDQQLKEASEVLNELAKGILSSINDASKDLNAAGELKEKLQTVSSHLAKALEKFDRASDLLQPIVSPIRAGVSFVLEQIKMLLGTTDFFRTLVIDWTSTIKDPIQKTLSSISSSVYILQQWINDSVFTPVKAALDSGAPFAIQSSKFQEQFQRLTEQDVKVARDAINQLRMHLTDNDRFLTTYKTEFKASKDKAVAAIESAAKNLQEKARMSIIDMASQFDKTQEFNRQVIDKTAEYLTRIVDDGIREKGCNELSELTSKLDKALDEAKKWAKQHADATLAKVFSSDAARQLAELAVTTSVKWDEGSQGIVCARALGSLPVIPPLNFDIKLASYVLDNNIAMGIQMTPALALQGYGGANLVESLGLSVPCSKLMDQLVPEGLEGLEFNKIFKNFAGIDFRGLFAKFKLPKLNGENVSVTHGFDKPTRRVWVNSTVKFKEDKRQPLFELGPVALALEKMDFYSFSGVESFIVEGTPQLPSNPQLPSIPTALLAPTSITKSSLTADWILQGGGMELVRFKQVAITYDGVAGFDFSISPNAIELHPSLKFISEYVSKLSGKIPPAISIEAENGRPVGVSAGMTVVVDAMELGGVLIGPIDMRSKLALVAKNGFAISSSFSLGNKQSPVFVQVSFMGGGCWLEAKAEYNNGVVTPIISFGLSMGSVRALNIGSVAQGTYSFQLYCYIEINPRQTSIAIGLSICGDARIICFVNAGLNLLLEAQYKDKKTEGTGRLDVRVTISWCFTFRFKHTVKQRF